MALVTTPNNHVLRANKENEQPFSTPSSINSSQHRVVFSNQNKEHFFGPVPNPTPPSSQEPSKSILKKRTYDEFLAEDIFPPEKLRRATTPEPENACEVPTFLLSPIRILVQSWAPGTFPDLGEVDTRDIIEAHSVLAARIRSKLLSTPVNGNKAMTAARSSDVVLHPALEPLLKYLGEIASVIKRDIYRALEDPIKPGERAVESVLPSPPPSSPCPFDSSPTSSVSAVEQPKKAGMSEQQVTHARDLCTVSQSAMRLFASLLGLTGLINTNKLFTKTQLVELLDALLAVPLAYPLPTPNSRKTCALAINVVTASSFPEPVLAKLAPKMARVFKRGIDGELGREGKKGSAADSFRAVLVYSIEYPMIFAPSFASMLPSILKGVQGSGTNLQLQAGLSLAGLAYASTEANMPTEAVAQALEPYLTISKKKGTQEIQMSSLFTAISKFFQALTLIYAAKDSGESNKVQATAAMQGLAHTQAMWSLSVLSSIIILARGKLLNNKAMCSAVIKILRLLLVSKRVVIRTVASWGWRALIWSIMKEFEELDFDEKNPTWRSSLVQRSFDFLDKNVGSGVVCALLVGSAGREDRELRVSLAIEAIMEMAKKRATTPDALHVLQRMLSNAKETELEGPSPGWDLSKLLPTSLFDSQLAEADLKSVTTLTKQQAALETHWIDEIPALCRTECEGNLDEFFEVWRAGVKSFGIDEKGFQTEEVKQAWISLLEFCPIPPTERMDVFFDEPPHVWVNLADPGDVPAQVTAHQVVQVRFIKALWAPLVARFGVSEEMRQLALDIYNRSLSLFHFHQGKVEDVCLEMFFQLSEIESSIVGLLMNNDEFGSSLKHSFWCQASSTAQNETLIRSLLLAPFGHKRNPFQFNNEDWYAWEQLWKLYMNERGNSPTERTQLQQLFAEDLSETVSAREGSIIVTSILRSLPLSARVTSDSTSVWSLVNVTLTAAYESEDPETVEIATRNLDVLAQALPSIAIENLALISPGLTLWLSDVERLMTDEEYDSTVPAVYDGILELIGNVSSVDTLVDNCKLLVSIAERITPTLSTIKRFKQFWKEQYEGKIDPEQIPKDLCPLLLAMDEVIPEAQDESRTEPLVEEVTVQTYEEDEDTVDNDSQEVPPSTDAEDLSDAVSETDSLSTVAPPSEAPETEEDDLSPPASPWTGSFDGISAYADNQDSGEEESDENDENGRSPIFKVSRVALSQSQSIVTPSKHSKFKNSTISSLSKTASFTFFGASIDPSLSTSKSRKRRSLDNHDYTPVKRRKSETPESDSDEDPDTPTRPWFEKDLEPEEETIPGLSPVPFQPFARNNLPAKPFVFSGGQSTARYPPRRSAKGGLQPVVPTLRSVQKRLSQESLALSNDRKLFADCGLADKGNPASKRRRLDVSQDNVSPTVTALHMAPFSDQIEPGSDDVQSLPPAGSDDSCTSENAFSPETIRSPSLARGEAGSDDSVDSNDSPTKAHVDRKKRMQESWTTSTSLQSTQPSRTIPPDTLRQIFSQSAANGEVDKAIDVACSLFSNGASSMGSADLLKVSRLLEDLRTQVNNELKERNSSVFKGHAP